MLSKSSKMVSGIHFRLTTEMNRSITQECEKDAHICPKICTPEGGNAVICFTMASGIHFSLTKEAIRSITRECEKRAQEMFRNLHT